MKRYISYYIYIFRSLKKEYVLDPDVQDACERQRQERRRHENPVFDRIDRLARYPGHDREIGLGKVAFRAERLEAIA